MNVTSNKPTRTLPTGSNSSTKLDYILTNVNCNHCFSNLFEPYIKDHMAPFLERTSENSNENWRTVKFSDLSSHNFDVVGKTDLNKMYSLNDEIDVTVRHLLFLLHTMLTY